MTRIAGTTRAGRQNEEQQQEPEAYRECHRLTGPGEADGAETVLRTLLTTLPRLTGALARVKDPGEGSG